MEGRGRSSRRHSRGRSVVQQLDAEADAARDQRHLARLGVQQPELGAQQQPAALRHDQQLAVGVAEDPVGHGGVGGVEVDGHAGALGGVAVAAQGPQPGQEVGAGPAGSGSGFQRSRLGSGTDSVKGARAERAVVGADERRVRGRGADAVEPGAAVVGARLGERRAAELLRVQARAGRAGGSCGPRGSAPGTASELCSLPKPERYASPSAVFLACSLPVPAHRVLPPLKESYADHRIADGGPSTETPGHVVGSRRWHPARPDAGQDGRVQQPTPRPARPVPPPLRRAPVQRRSAAAPGQNPRRLRRGPGGDRLRGAEHPRRGRAGRRPDRLRLPLLPQQARHGRGLARRNLDAYADRITARLDRTGATSPLRWRARDGYRGRRIPRHEADGAGLRPGRVHRPRPARPLPARPTTWSPTGCAPSSPDRSAAARRRRAAAHRLPGRRRDGRRAAPARLPHGPGGRSGHRHRDQGAAAGLSGALSGRAGRAGRGERRADPAA